MRPSRSGPPHGPSAGWKAPYRTPLVDESKSLAHLTKASERATGITLATLQFDLGKRAKQAARQATAQACAPQRQPYRTKSTTINIARAELRGEKALPEGVGRYSREIDTALPGKHTRILYDTLGRREAGVLAQLRTGATKLNGYLHRIGAAESDQCACGQAKETIKHFLFWCTIWAMHRAQMLQQTETRRGSLSFYLEGKAASNPEQWTPNMNAVRATIKYTLATGRLDPQLDSNPSQVQSS